VPICPLRPQSKMRVRLIAIVVVALSSARVDAQQPKNPMDSIAKLPSFRAAHDTIPMLTNARIAALPPNERQAWLTYLDSSAAQHARDTSVMNAELRAAGKTAMTRAPYTHGFEVDKHMTTAWFTSDSARRMADIILSFQAPNGGWSKHVDFSVHQRQPGESYFSETDKWSWISTIDNSSTTEEIHFLALADQVRHDGRYTRAVDRGVKYLLASQYPNGCWPQVWPLEGSYHDAATFNDDASVNAASLLQEVADGKYPYVEASDVARSRAAVGRAIECFVATQTRVNGTLAVWGQQHDPISLEPTSARSYELTSLTAQESANIMRFLMRVKSPSQAVVASVHSAADWLKANELFGFIYTVDGGRKEAPGAGPVWARMYEISTGKPIFSDRNGITLYDWNQLKDRRQGYGWYTYAPVATLKDYAKWAVKHPRAASVASGIRDPAGLKG
jgi:PelA/Pel-15E family pectate lyase